MHVALPQKHLFLLSLSYITVTVVIIIITILTILLLLRVCRKEFDLAPNEGLVFALSSWEANSKP